MEEGDVFSQTRRATGPTAPCSAASSLSGTRVGSSFRRAGAAPGAACGRRSAPRGPRRRGQQAGVFGARASRMLPLFSSSSGWAPLCASTRSAANSTSSMPPGPFSPELTGGHRLAAHAPWAHTVISPDRTALSRWRADDGLAHGIKARAHLRRPQSVRASAAWCSPGPGINCCRAAAGSRHRPGSWSPAGRSCRWAQAVSISNRSPSPVLAESQLMSLRTKGV